MRASLWVILLGWVGLCFTAPASSATEIRFKDGSVVTNARILRRDAAGMEVQVPYGVIYVPLGRIESVDGESFTTSTTTVPATVPPAADSPAGVMPSAGQSRPLERLAGPYAHHWAMEVFLGVLLLLSAVWLGLLLWVQKDADARWPDQPAMARRWNSVALLLPGIGFLVYLFARWRQSRQEAAAAAAEEETATGLDLAAGRDKRPLFGGRARATVEPRPKPKIGFEFLDEDGNPIQIKKDLPEMTGIEAAREVLEEALMERASDVHIEPQERDYRVRFRIDGLLQERLVFEKADGTRVVSALKTLAQIDVAEKRKAQDGRFRVRTGVRDVDFRVATAASIYGEKMVLRILDRRGGRLGLDELGMPPEMLAEFDRILHSRSGIILATGPTGSGKTSTLYAALSRLDTRRLNVMTIEDPVEYELAGATQIPVNPRAGVTYESGLRSIMRQDPDVIFVGEMRDKEAAEIAIRAALTGHLVFSTLHTKDAIGTIARLEDMGIVRYQIAAALLLVVAQRLVRVLCRECRQPYEASGREFQELGLSVPPATLLYRAVGCQACDQTGYQGRTGIFELLVVDDELRRAINENRNHQEMADLVRRKGFRSYYEDGVNKVCRGLTSVEEVLQAS